MMKNVPEEFGSMVFNDKVMQQKLPKDVYKKLKQTIKNGKPLELDIANVVAHAMKEWAIEKGATHFTHWFQPLTGVTAEKHDSFITPDGDGNVIMSFSGKELVKGEPDASSFPSGGIRATFEARGYTAWDPTSYALVKDGSLCIPTAYCSYTGEALDKKTPLLRSMEALSTQAMRILKLFGSADGVKNVQTTVGPEQEYFLVDRDVYLQRPDLIYTGRTLFGARPPKGQELDDHYFGQIKTRVSEYMKDLDEELWKLGINAKTKHNEVAPAQHELAPVFDTTNVATDHNQLTMEIMKKVAEKHNLACLLHEKPFAGVNGSGKHNNWSISTNTGKNLLEPGDTPYENAQFLLYLLAVIKAVDEHQDLMRISVASAGNDHRLGANEAPPAIISMFVGDELEAILEALEAGVVYKGSEKVEMDIGSTVLPHFPRDTTDRNRTSPFAFTGNKFEFRSLGSSQSIAGPNVILNTIVADALEQFADELEKAGDFKKAVLELITRNIKEHKRIIFNGDGYSEEWPKEAAKRGLLNYKSTPEAVPHFADEANIELFEKHKVFTKTEVVSRTEIMLENYSKTIHIEALTMIDMIKKNVIPSVVGYENELVSLVAGKKAIGVSDDMESCILDKLSKLASSMYAKLNTLEDVVVGADTCKDEQELAVYSKEKIFESMQELRVVVDEIETIVAADYWTLPTYGEMLYSVL